MWTIRQDQIKTLDDDAKRRLIENWASSEEPLFNPGWDRLQLAMKTMVLAERYNIEGPVDQTLLNQIVIRYGSTFPEADEFRRHRMILASSDFSSSFRVEQLKLLRIQEA